MENPITRAEHNEFVKRMEDEHTRMNHRIERLEQIEYRLGELSASFGRFADKMESVAKMIENHEHRIEEFESIDGKKWRKVVEYIGLTVLGLVIGYVASKLGLG